MKMHIHRRRFLKSAAAGTVAATGPWFIPNLYADDAIKVAGIHDASGGLDIYCKPMINCLTLAVEDINAKGGLLGRKIDLINYDTQSNIQLYTQFATEAATKDRVAVVMGGITSASREAMRPVLDRFKTLYFYNTLYEGGVCDRNIFIVGTTPAQTLEKMIPYVMNKWGKKIYTLAADYIYGQTTAKWVKKYCVDNGGEVLSTVLSARCDKFRSDDREDPSREAGYCHVCSGRRRTYLFVPAVGSIRHEEADTNGLYDLRNW